MTNKNHKYPKQPKDPNRKASDSVTWVHNLNLANIGKRIVVHVKKPAYTPRPK